jgi:hypothetical protein
MKQQSNSLPSNGNPLTIPIQEMSEEQLNLLLRRDKVINVFSVIFVIMALVCLIIFLGAALDSSRPPNMAGLFIGTSIGIIIYGFLALGSIARISFLRVPTIIIFGIMLLGIPIGTILGIYGLMSFTKAQPLFGPDRIHQDEIKLEINKRKPQEVTTKSE